MPIMNPKLKIRNEAREGLDPDIVQPTLEAIVSLPSVQDGNHWNEDAPIIERAELQLTYGDVLAYIKGLYLDSGRGLCVVCMPSVPDHESYRKKDQQAIPVSKIFSYKRIITNDEA